ncbi:MAG TPA: hypothetical protein PKE17_04525, partial [Saprospiraceae bacterium]|nr:hypothetical protein [Saprospiraceae bacterium]
WVFCAVAKAVISKNKSKNVDCFSVVMFWCFCNEQNRIVTAKVLQNKALCQHFWVNCRMKRLNCRMSEVSLGFLFHGFMVSWFHGFMVSWFHGFMASWLHGFMASWLHGFMASWFHGFMVAWFHGFMALCNHENRAISILFPEKNKLLCPVHHRK